MKRLFSFILVLALSLSCVGYTSASGDTQGTVLWVVTEATVEDGMNYIASALAEKFAVENPGCTVRLDILPTKEVKREAYLETLREKIALGEGPDIYLLPATAQLITESPTKYSYYRLDSLFPDVNAAMQNGVFADLSSYYDNDTELGKEALANVIMEAGCENGKRFVLPLRFDMSTYFVIPSLAEEAGIDTACFAQDLGSCLEVVLNSGDRDLISGTAAANSPGLVSCPIHYKTGEICVQRSDLVECADLIGQILQQTECLPERYSISEYATAKHVQTMLPARIQSLSAYLDAAAIANAEGLEASVFPLRSIENQVTATVTYYAAVDASCEEMELAYNYLRMFLSEEAQWEALRREPAFTQYPTLLEQSFPVRTKGALSGVWGYFKAQAFGADEKKRQKLFAYVPDEATLDNLIDQIDQAYILTDAVAKLDTVFASDSVEESVDDWLAALRTDLGK